MNAQPAATGSEPDVSQNAPKAASCVEPLIQWTSDGCMGSILYDVCGEVCTARGWKGACSWSQISVLSRWFYCSLHCMLVC